MRRIFFKLHNCEKENDFVSTVTASNGNNLDWQIAGGTIANGTGALVDDNKTDDTDIIITVASTVAGVDETTISTLTTTTVASAGAVTFVALTTDKTTNTAWAAGNLYTGTTVERKVNIKIDTSDWEEILILN